MKRAILVGSIIAAVLAVLAGVAFIRTAEGGSSWNELDSVQELRARFNEDEGSIRIVLLLSPT